MAKMLTFFNNYILYIALIIFILLLKNVIIHYIDILIVSRINNL